jgi:PhnB protein
MPTKVKPIPEGFHAVTPYLCVNDAAKAIQFYQKAFGAKEIMRMNNPTGKVGHAELQIGDSRIMLADEMPQPGGCRAPQSVGGTTVGIFLYVNDCDSVFQQAVAAGAKGDMPPADMFWGDRFAKLTDPFGHSWNLATHKEDVAPAEMERRGKEMFAKMAQQQPQTQHAKG